MSVKVEAPKSEATCPSCGYCPSCGRRAAPYWPSPWPYIPTYPSYPRSPIWAGGSSSGSYITYGFTNTNAPFTKTEGMS